MANTISCHVDKHSAAEWDRIIQCFDDANIYQTSSYAQANVGGGSISRLVVLRDDRPIAAALLRIVKIRPFLKGIAYVRWGPMWRTGGMVDRGFFHEGVRALMHEYVERRGFVLRIRPFIYEDETASFHDRILQDEGCLPLSRWPREKTLRIDLRPPLEELRKGLDQKWRNQLNSSEKNELTIIEGTHDELFNRLAPIHEELMERKNISGIATVKPFREIQAKLAEDMRMRVVLVEHRGEVCAGLIISTIGKTGVLLVQASSMLGRQMKASYLVQWRAMQVLKAAGCEYYDLGGINSETNPGTYLYKKGLCGKNGQELLYLNQYEVHRGKISRFLLAIIDALVLNSRRYRRGLHKIFKTAKRAK